MKTTLLAAIAALSLAATGTAFAGEGNGPDYPAYNAGIAAIHNGAALVATVPTLSAGNSDAYFVANGQDTRVQSNVSARGNGGTATFDGIAAQFPGAAPTTTAAAGSVAQGG